MNIGYARISTGEQMLDLQTDALTDAGCQRIFTDTVSGAKFDRPGLKQATEFARSGDTLVVWRLDRLGRSLKELIELVQDLENDGIGLRSLQEQLDTTTATGKLIYHVFGALAEFERNLIAERTRAGLAAARARGRSGGRPQTLTREQIRDIQIMYDSGIPIGRIAKQFNVSRSTLYSKINVKPVNKGENNE